MQNNIFTLSYQINDEYASSSRSAARDTLKFHSRSRSEFHVSLDRYACSYQ